MAYTREEITAAFDRYKAAAAEAGATGNWRPWVECFTSDTEYVEHLYGVFHGREAVYAWVTETMSPWPVNQMREFPWDWSTIDVEQGFIVGQVQNVFADPGDGQTYTAANWTRLDYAGDGLFSREEDVYNPEEFTTVVKGWLRAWKTHHPDSPTGP
jgi:hypothetical protein